jgi:hypothetical protein
VLTLVPVFTFSQGCADCWSLLCYKRMICYKRITSQ